MIELAHRCSDSGDPTVHNKKNFVPKAILIDNIKPTDLCADLHSITLIEQHTFTLMEWTLLMKYSNRTVTFGVWIIKEIA